MFTLKGWTTLREQLELERPRYHERTRKHTHTHTYTYTHIITVTEAETEPGRVDSRQTHLAGPPRRRHVQESPKASRGRAAPRELSCGRAEPYQARRAAGEPDEPLQLLHSGCRTQPRKRVRSGPPS